MNGKQLKNSILQWAIQGKLVPQDPNDEPASVLLKRIREEKAKLVKEKKIKKDKNESIIYRGEDNSYYEKFLTTGEVKCIDDEIPFEIPDSWEWGRFGYIANHAPQVSCEDDVEVAFMPMAYINAGYGSSFSYEQKKWRDVKSGFTKIQEGDIAYAKITPCFQNRKSFILHNVPGHVAAATTELNVIRIYGDSFIPWYLLYILKSDYFIKEARYKGTAGQQRVLVDYVKSKLIPIPPRNEQERICSILSKVMPVTDRYEKSQVILNNLNKNLNEALKKSILQEAIQGRLVPQIAEEGTATELLAQIKAEKQKLVKEGKLKKSALTDSIIYKGDDNKYYEQVGEEVADITAEIPFELPESWSWCRLRDICQIMTGATFKKEEANNSGKGVRVLRGGNITPFRLLFKSDDLYIPTDKVKNAILLKQSDIVTPAVTSLENIGKMALVHKDYDTVTVGGFVFIIRCHLKSCAFTEYLQYIMSAPATIEFIQSVTNKSGQAFYNIGKERLSTALIPIPPLGEVQRINDKIETLFSLS